MDARAPLIPEPLAGTIRVLFPAALAAMILVAQRAAELDPEASVTLAGDGLDPVEVRASTIVGVLRLEIDRRQEKARLGLGKGT